MRGADWVNVFKAGKGTVTVWESVGGTKGALLYKLTGIPLTPCGHHGFYCSVLCMLLHVFLVVPSLSLFAAGL